MEQDLDLVMLMCNLLEYICSLWFYSKDEADDFGYAIANTNTFKSCKYRSKIIAVPLKYLSNFRRSHEMPLINCKVELKLRWTKNCV